MDYQAVGAPTNYGAPLVFQGGQGQQQQNPVAAALAKAKQLLSSGQISSAQYSQLAGQLGNQGGELATMAGNMGAGMPGATGAPMNILPGAG